MTASLPDEFGIIGLGRMGGGLAAHALELGMRVVGVDPKGVPDELATDLEQAKTYADLASRLRPPRLVFVYVPAGPLVDEIIDAVAATLQAGDVIVDGGNSYWGDSIRRARRLANSDVGFVDLGTSGGVDGAREGACFMAGGEQAAVARAQPILERLAVPGGYVHAGPSGAGHFVKLVHNGIEFGMLQAIGEGVDLLEHWPCELPVAEVLRCWRHGSVIRSWLVDLMEQQYRELGSTKHVPSFVDDTGEVNWLVADALQMERPIPVITHSVLQLLASRDESKQWARAVAMMRRGFGGHAFGRSEAVEKERRQGRVSELWRRERREHE
jgi:6-phosphogluconate dehydrogenase